MSMNKNSFRNLTLLTDLYELTMMQGYFKTGNHQRVIFEIFFRNNPFGSGYSIACGLAQAIEYVKNLHFGEEEINYLKSLKIFDDDFLEYLADFKFTGDIYAVPEGTPVFPKVPLLKVIAPIDQAQLMESALLNILNHQSLIATKAARVCYSAGDTPVMEFGLRRAQGPDAGIYGARAAVIAGCIGTSNVLSGQMFDVLPLGTHAHSWIMSFPSEYEAFKAYANLYPDSCTLLVDTYDTLKSGVPNAIKVFQEMRDSGKKPSSYGIRLDSGDLAYLTKKARVMLDEAGFEDAVISASGDLDEYLVESLRQQGAPIGAWGIGTKMITAYDQPAFGGVYKIAAIEDENGEFIPKIKISENTAKITNPGDKEVYRVYDENGIIFADLITLSSESYDENEPLELFDPKETWKRTTLEPGKYSLRKLLVQVFKDGECVYDELSTDEIRAYCAKEKETLWDEVKRLFNPHEVHVDLSAPLYELKNEMLHTHSKKDYIRK